MQVHGTKVDSQLIFVFLLRGYSNLSTNSICRFYYSRLNASGTQIWVPTLFVIFITEGWMQVVLKVEYQLYLSFLLQ